MKKLSYMQESFFIIPFPTLIMFCKPCSVPSYCKRLVASYSGGNHLSTDGKAPSVLPSVHFLREGAPTIIWVSRSWGLPRSTSKVSLRATSLWHFQGNRTISHWDLGSFPAVSPALRQTALAYGFARHEHYGHLSTVRAWTFLYGNAAAAITRTLLTSFAHCSIVYFLGHFNSKFS
jgi:hypothetical protein